MSTTTLHPLAADYLDRLRHAGRRLPRAAQRELVAEIEAHLFEATDPAMSDAEVLTVLDRLGDPDTIVDAQAPGSQSAPDGRGTHEWAAIFLLLFGGFVFGVGWIAGLILLWSSRAWTTRDKWIGTLIWPGGLAGAVYFGLFFAAAGGSVQTCSPAPTVVSINGKVVHHLHHSAQRCGGGASTGSIVLSIVVLTIVVLAPITTSMYLARRAR